MKPEPLKNKTQYHNVKNAEGKTNQKYPYHYDDDIKSAVEYLKQMINDYTFKTPLAITNENKIVTVIDLIDEAFEDVIKKH